MRLIVYIVQTFSNIKIIIEESRNERTDSLVEDVTGIELEHGTDFELKKEKVVEVEVQGKLKTSDDEGILLQVEQILHKIYSSVAAASTQQEKVNVFRALQDVYEKKIVNPAIKTEQLRPPSVNLNRKGRHSTKPGVKSGATRLQIYCEIFEKKQLNDLKKNVKMFLFAIRMEPCLLTMFKLKQRKKYR